MTELIRDRAKGALYGQAVGDALGTTQEFSAPTARPFPELNLGPQTGIVGGGPFRVRPGQVTDDTQLAACLASSLAERGRFDVDDVGRRYVAWSEVAFDIGNQTAATLALVSRGASPRDSGFLEWSASSRRPAGNGSLMRQSPLPVFFAGRREELRAAVLEDGAITHADPRCQLACAGFAAAIQHLITTVDATPKSASRVAADELAIAMPELDPRISGDLAEEATEAILMDLELAAQDDPKLYGDIHLHRAQGFVRVAFRLAFWELLHAPDFKSALLDVTNRGGDADTNGAITGALLGAYHGAARIDEAWKALVDQALGGETGPFATTYHPRALFRVLP
ncbi:MAG: ADP-ribosylglycohydrolase family protein [Deltaproteobacteria bacterium]|nr:ADP-ribosylglycohydrolase family protein [Deltaproteobacteria bacterium]